MEMEFTEYFVWFYLLSIGRCFGGNIFAEMITFLLLSQGIGYAACKNPELY